MNGHALRRHRQRGFALLEVLITIVITAFGLLGLLGMQGKMELAEVEAYQRAQATLLVGDMADRMRASPFAACSSAATTIAQQNLCMAARLATYPTSTPLGTGDSQPTDCSTQTLGAGRDECQWSNALKGVAETNASVDMGAMTGARGCIEQIQAPDPTAGVCTPGIYRVSAVWQGLNPTAPPSLTCGTGLYGSSESYRRAIAMRVSVSLPLCK